MSAKARLRLFDAVESLAHARAEAGWYHGYRSGGKDTAEAQQKESGWWERVGLARLELHRAVRAYAKAVREQRITPKRSLRASGRSNTQGKTSKRTREGAE